MSYNEALKDPRWQKKRLEILERDGWACKICDSKDKTLHVHHKYYTEETRKEPWDITDKALVTLCYDCHEQCDQGYYFSNLLAKSIYDSGAITGYDLETLGELIHDSRITHDELKDFFDWNGIQK